MDSLSLGSFLSCCHLVFSKSQSLDHLVGESVEMTLITADSSYSDELAVWYGLFLVGGEERLIMQVAIHVCWFAVEGSV